MRRIASKRLEAFANELERRADEEIDRCDGTIPGDCSEAEGASDVLRAIAAGLRAAADRKADPLAEPAASATPEARADDDAKAPPEAASDSATRTKTTAESAGRKPRRTR